MITPKITNLGYSNLWTDMSTILGYASNFDQQIKKLFANGEQGFAYDPNDLSMMFQNAAGTIPVTATGQPVGLMLDKSRGLVLGTNVISNSNFTSLNRWTSGSFMQAVLVQDGVQISSPTSTTKGLVDASASNHLSWSPIIPAGKRFKITFDAKHVSGTGVLEAGSSFSVGLQIDPNENGGVFKRYTTEVTGSLGGFATAATFGATNGSVWVINNVVSQEVIGNHAYQTTSASRPILRQNAVTGTNYLEFDGTDDYLIVAKDNLKFLHDGTGATGFVGFKTSGAAVYHTLLNTGDLSDASVVGYVLAQDNRVSGNLINVTTNGSGTIHVNNFVTVGISTNPRVISFKNKLGTHVVRQNGSQILNTLTETGSPSTALSSNNLWIGRAPAGFPLSGNLYGLVCINRLTTDSETLALEKTIAKNTGVTLNV